MSIPKLYTVHSFDEGDTSSIDILTDFKSGITNGSDGENYSILSYFPKTLKYSQLSNFITNKYVLFVSNANEAKDYSVEWFCNIFDSEGSVKDRFTVETSAGSHNFEYVIGFKDLIPPTTLDWELTLRIECHVSKNGEGEEILALEHIIQPIEASLLSVNGASFEDESGLDNSTVPLGNEPTTHFVYGHLGDYLVAKKKLENGDGDPELNNASAFIHQTTAIAYNNVLSGINHLAPNGSGYSNAQFSHLFSNQSLEQTIIQEKEFNSNEYRYIGICSLHLHHVLPIILGGKIDRVGLNIDILTLLKKKFDSHYEDFIIAYHRCVFPKSAIGLSVDIFNRLFAAFKEDANESNHIYKTYKVALADKKAKITEWKNLNYSELREKSNDKFMKNLLAEYFMGHFNEIGNWMTSHSRPRRILKIDWSQFIQKILNPAAITIPFTLVKVQVNDLRSGKPIKNTLIKRLEFHSFLSLPGDGTDIKFAYEVTHVNDKNIRFNPDDSKNERVQKICKTLGYYAETISDKYTAKMRTAIYTYMTSTDRLLAFPNDLPLEVTDKYINTQKDIWCDYIIDDFEANCITDDDGILNCRVPDELLKDCKLNINVGFSEFTIVQETSLEKDEPYISDRPIKRPISLDGTPSTYFLAHWVGDPKTKKDKVNPNQQSLDWDLNLSGDKNFGWKITESYGMETAHIELKTNQLRLAIPLEVKKLETEEYSFLKSRIDSGFLDGVEKEEYEHFSTFYKETGIHFVLYGMQWCQPVWDEYDDTETVNGNRKHSFIQDGGTQHPNMSIVTDVRDMGGEFNYGGKGYGKFENRPLLKDTIWRHRTGKRGHLGYDVHAIIDARVFAFHYGKLSNSTTNKTLGKKTTISWSKYGATLPGECKIIAYGHLDAFLIPKGQIVMAGTVVAKGGREGNIKTAHSYPSHVHINVSISDRPGRIYYPNLRKTMDDYHPENGLTLPSNFSPLLFPCRSEVKSTNLISTSCRHNDDRFTPSCWASAELCCPHINKEMRKSNETSFQLQTQLRYLNEKPEDVEKKDDLPMYPIKSEKSKKYPNHKVDTGSFLTVNNNENYFHPGSIDGDLGDAITKIKNSKLIFGTSLTNLSTVRNNANHVLKSVKYEESPGVKKTTWIESSFIATNNTISELIQNVPAVKPSKTQMAIYTFRSQHDLLKMDNYYLNFTTDDEFWAELNTQCGF